MDNKSKQLSKDKAVKVANKSKREKKEEYIMNLRNWKSFIVKHTIGIVAISLIYIVILFILYQLNLSKQELPYLVLVLFNFFKIVVAPLTAGSIALLLTVDKLNKKSIWLVVMYLIFGVIASLMNDKFILLLSEGIISPLLVFLFVSIFLEKDKPEKD
uniref:hypothetical protein n=1 Tax=Carnobacterium sp. TaxID=48221 RepID=UPI00345019B5